MGTCTEMIPAFSLLSHQVRAAVAHTLWKAWWAFVVEGRPAKDIAAEVGLSVNAVYLAQGRVLGRLREELSGLMELGSRPK